MSCLAIRVLACLLCGLTLVFVGHLEARAETVAIATYNIRFLSADGLSTQGSRKQRLQDIVRQLDADLDADDINFLFPGSVNNSAFPNRRDVLFARLKVKETDDEFFVMVGLTRRAWGLNDPSDTGSILVSRNLSAEGNAWKCNHAIMPLGERCIASLEEFGK